MNQLLVSLFPYFCILSLSAIAIIFTERAGIINLGINGIIVSGATTYMIMAYIISPLAYNSSTPANPWLNVFLYAIAALGGILFSLLHGLISIKMKGNQTISGIALNILAPSITLVILYLFGDAHRMEYSVSRLELGNSKNFELISFVSLKMFVTILVIIISFVVLTFSRWGLRLKSIGENPQAADAAGINVTKMKWLSIIISGAIAGIAGAIYISEISDGGAFKSQVNVEGLGFLAIAIVILSKWKPLNVALVTIIFSILFSLGKNAVDLFPNGKEIKPILLMLPYLLTLLVLIIFSKPLILWLSKVFEKLSNKMIKMGKNENKKSNLLSRFFNWCSIKLISFSNSVQPPKALGIPYDKSQR